MDRTTSGWRAELEAEDKIAAERFRDAASLVARDAAECADRLAHAVGLNLDSPAGAEQACAVFTEARRWEVQAWNRFKDLTRGCRPALGGIWPERPTFPPADGETLADAESKLRSIALRLDGAARGTASVLMVPDEVQPPRHAGLKGTINAQVLADDLLKKRHDRPSVSATPADVRQWVLDVQKILGGLEAAPDYPDPGTQFRDLTQGIEAADNPLVADPASLRHAYVLLGVDYVMEVHRKMQDYAEAGRPSRDPVITFTVTGGTVNVGQMAGRITNTESTIQGVANQGDDRTAEGLRDVGQAVLDEPSLDDETRRDLLDQVQFLAESAQQEPTKRKRGVVRQALAVLEDAATAGTKIGAAMNVWGEVLHKILS